MSSAKENIKITSPNGEQIKGGLGIVNDVLSFLANTVEKGIMRDATRTALEESKRELVSKWNSYVYGDLLTDYGGMEEVLTKEEGQPVDGATVVDAAKERLFDVRKFAPKSENLGHFFSYRFNLYSVEELDRLTGPNNSMPLWSLFNWGSGDKLEIDEVEGARTLVKRSYKMSSGLTSQEKSYNDDWIFLIKYGLGERGVGIIIPTRVVKTYPTIEMKDFSAGHMFDRAVFKFWETLIDEVEKVNPKALG